MVQGMNRKVTIQGVEFTPGLECARHVGLAQVIQGLGSREYLWGSGWRGFEPGAEGESHVGIYVLYMGT